MPNMPSPEKIVAALGVILTHLSAMAEAGIPEYGHDNQLSACTREVKALAIAVAPQQATSQEIMARIAAVAVFACGIATAYMLSRSNKSGLEEVNKAIATIREFQDIEGQKPGTKSKPT